jgi:hypothetical protein
MATGVLTRHEVALLRLVALGLVGGHGAAGDDAAGGAADVVRRLLAVQAQDLPGALTSVALRTADRSRARVAAALDSGDVVRTWPMRGTLHLVAAEDVTWFLATTAARPIAASVGRRTGLGLTEAIVGHARDVAGRVLADGGLRRADLLRCWQDAGIDTDGQRGYHLIAHLAMTGTLVLGPVHPGASGGPEQLVVLSSTWLPEQRVLDGDEALGELALRFLLAHGPATVADLVRWAGITVGAARQGIAVARPRLASVEVDGVEHLLDPEVPDALARCRDEASALLLLPGFDEYVLGYADRSAVLAPEHRDRIVPGGNGVFRPTVVLDGQVVGTWRSVPGRRGAPSTLRLEPFAPLPADVVGAAEEAYSRLP